MADNGLWMLYSNVFLFIVKTGELSALMILAFQLLSSVFLGVSSQSRQLPVSYQRVKGSEA